MKTQKIFLLVVVMLLALVMTVACGDDNTTPEYFAFDEDTSYSTVHELEGTVIATNLDAGLVAMQTEKVNASSSLEIGIKVYDVNNDYNVVFQDVRGYSSSDTHYAEVDISNYPVVTLITEISSGSDSEGNPQYEKRYSHYLLGRTGYKCIAGSLEENDLKVSKVDNVYLVESDDTLYWVSRHLDVMRTIATDVADTYPSGERYFDIQAEWGNYLYTWEFDPASASQVVLIYDSNGVCCAKYSFTPGTIMVQNDEDSILNPSVYVLNSGFVLVQECITVEDGEEFDFEYTSGAETYKLDLKTKLVDYSNGSAIEVDFNYLITDLESAYARMDDETFPFTLAEDEDNQALLVPIEDGKLGRAAYYAVISNGLEIKYTLNNTYLSLSAAHSTIKDADADGYTATAIIGGVERTCRFDWNGNITFTQPTNYKGTAGEYYYTDSGVYNMAGELVFAIEGSEFASTDKSAVKAVGDVIYLQRYNYETDGDETYVLNADKTTTLIADGVKSHFEVIDDAFAMVHDEQKGTYTFYSASGEAVLIIAEDDLVNRQSVGDAYVVEVNVGGKTKAYVLGFSFENENEEENK